MKNTKPCKVIMLPTEKASSIIKEDNVLKYNPSKIDIGVKEYLNLYIISEDKIKEGNFFIRLGILYQADKDFLKTYNSERTLCKKVVATTDKDLIKNFRISQIPESFVNSYIKVYNEGMKIESVDLKMELNQCDGCQANLPLENGIHKDNQTFGKACTKHLYSNIKTREDNTVICHQSKMYSREEVIILICKAIQQFGTDSVDTLSQAKRKDKEINNWIQENI